MPLLLAGEAAEIGPQGVEWEPRERSLSFGRGPFEGQFSWQVRTEQGERLDGSAPGAVDRLLAGTTIHIEDHPSSVRDARGRTWRILHRRLVARPFPPEETAGTDEPAVPGSKHDALILSAAEQLEPVRGTLRNLALALIGLSLGVWSLALVCGRG